MSSAEEVDDVVTTMMIDSMPAAGLSCSVAGEHWAHTAPNTRVKGTAVPFTGLVQGSFGVRSTDLPGLPSRGAPV